MRLPVFGHFFVNLQFARYANSALQKITAICGSTKLDFFFHSREDSIRFLFIYVRLQMARIFFKRHPILLCTPHISILGMGKEFRNPTEKWVEKVTQKVSDPIWKIYDNFEENRSLFNFIPILTYLLPEPEKWKLKF